MNNKDMTLEYLEKSGMYTQELIESLKEKKLYNIPVDRRGDSKFMEPILYAIKKEFKTYEVFTFYSPSLQDNKDLALEILASHNEAYLLEGTPLCNNMNFILDNAKTYPIIIKYMSDELKKDEEVIQGLIDLNNPLVLKETIQNCDISLVLENNPELSNSKEFMGLAIEKDVSFLMYASEQLRDDKEFLREKSAQNSELIDFAVNNMEYLGLEGIKGIRETSKEFTIDDCMTLLDEMSKTSDDGRYEKVKNKVIEKGVNDPWVVRYVTAMAAQKEDLDPSLIKDVLNYSMLTMERTKRELTNEGEKQVNIENVAQLITPGILNRLVDNLKAQGVKIDEELQQRIDEYTEFYNDYHDKFVEQKIEKNNNISRNEVNEATDETRISEIKGVKYTIKKGNNKTIDPNGPTEIDK